MSERHDEDEGYIRIAKAARLAGMKPRRMRSRLRALQRKHGGVLFRFGDAPNSPLLTTVVALRRLMPERFDEVSELDLIELRSMLLEAQQRIGRLERKVANLEGRGRAA